MDVAHLLGLPNAMWQQQFIATSVQFGSMSLHTLTWVSLSGMPSS
jgi:hypothetical protein